MSSNITIESGPKTAKSGRQRRLKVFIALAGLLVVALAIATVVQERDTKPADADIGKILKVRGAEIQVREDGRGAPIVLIHGYASSMHWWRRNVSALSRSHRVIRIDLLGHGGSEKPRSGYSMQNQARLVASVLRKKKVSSAHVVGHSMGGTVTAALAEQNPELVGRITIIGSPADESDGNLPLLGRLIYVPVIGHAMRTITPRPLVREGLKSAFVPGYDDVPDQFVDDYLRINYKALVESGHRDYLEKSLPSRLRKTGKPLQVIFGRKDQIVKPSALQKYRSDVPKSEARYVENAGHTPQYEKPKRVNRLILDFSAERSGG